MKIVYEGYIGYELNSEVIGDEVNGGESLRETLNTLW